jgi:hypothetical protein
MGRDTLIIEARLALANWEKYNDSSDEVCYQANKMAKVLKAFIREDSLSPL